MHREAKKENMLPHLMSVIAIILLICTVVVLDFVNLAEDQTYAATKISNPVCEVDKTYC